MWFFDSLVRKGTEEALSVAEGKTVSVVCGPSDQSSGAHCTAHFNIALNYPQACAHLTIRAPSTLGIVFHSFSSATVP